MHSFPARALLTDQVNAMGGGCLVRSGLVDKVEEDGFGSGERRLGWWAKTVRDVKTVSPLIR